MVIPALTRCHYQISAIKSPTRTITSRPYPYFPITIGDYLRKRRLDPGLRQKDVAGLKQLQLQFIIGKTTYANLSCKPFLELLTLSGFVLMTQVY